MELPPTEGSRWACGPAKAARWPEAPGATELARASLSAAVVSALGTQPGLGSWGGGGGVLCKDWGVTGRGKISRGTCQTLKIRIPALSWCLESVYLKKRASHVRR